MMARTNNTCLSKIPGTTLTRAAWGADLIDEWPLHKAIHTCIWDPLFQSVIGVYWIPFESHFNLSRLIADSWIPEVSDFSETCVTWVADSREHDGTHQAKGQDGVGSLPAVESDLCARGKEFDGIWSLYHRSNDVAKLNIKSSSWEFRSVGVWLQECTTPYRAPRLSSGLWTWRTPKKRGTPSQSGQSWSSSFRATIGHPKCST